MRYSFMAKKLKVKDVLVGDNTVSVVVADAKDYLKMSAKTIKELTDSGVPGVYVTINKPYKLLKKEFKKV
mgnify:FL=1|jgi:hypothetical protein